MFDYHRQHGVGICIIHSFDVPFWNEFVLSELQYIQLCIERTLFTVSCSVRKWLGPECTVDAMKQICLDVVVALNPGHNLMLYYLR